MANDKYTTRDFLNSIIANEAVSDIDKVQARLMLAALDKRNEKRKNTPSKTQQANEPIKANILAYVSEHHNALAAEIATACAVSTQKVSALCKQMVEAGALTVADVKVKGKGTVKAYSVAE